jgi:hypothetical protein
MIVFDRYHFIMLAFLIIEFVAILISYFGKVSFIVASNQAIVAN